MKKRTTIDSIREKQRASSLFVITVYIYIYIPLALELASVIIVDRIRKLRINTIIIKRRSEKRLHHGAMLQYLIFIIIVHTFSI